MMANRIWLGVTLALLSAMLCSCRKSYQEVSVYPTSGKVTVKAVPAVGAYVTFHPEGDVGMTKGNKPFARVDKDGAFQVTTYDTNDGAPVGDYRVTVYWPENPDARGPSPDRLKGKYADPATTPLKATIDAKKLDLPAFELQ
jgi:hypothetical protein